MNYIKTFFNHETYRKFLLYIKPSSYKVHPELKIKGIPTERWKFLMTMRDLRLWIVENAPFSSRSQQYKMEIFRIHNEITVLQLKAFLKRFLIFYAICIWFVYWSPRKYHGAWTNYQNRPTHYGNTGGCSFVHDGAVPKLTQTDMNDIMGL